MALGAVLAVHHGVGQCGRALDAGIQEQIPAAHGARGLSVAVEVQQLFRCAGAGPQVVALLLHSLEDRQAHGRLSGAVQDLDQLQAGLDRLAHGRAHTAHRAIAPGCGNGAACIVEGGLHVLADALQVAQVGRAGAASGQAVGHHRGRGLARETIADQFGHGAGVVLHSPGSHAGTVPGAGDGEPGREVPRDVLQQELGVVRRVRLRQRRIDLPVHLHQRGQALHAHVLVRPGQAFVVELHAHGVALHVHLGLVRLKHGRGHAHHHGVALHRLHLQLHAGVRAHKLQRLVRRGKGVDHDAIGRARLVHRPLLEHAAALGLVDGGDVGVVELVDQHQHGLAHLVLLGEHDGPLVVAQDVLDDLLVPRAVAQGALLPAVHRQALAHPALLRLVAALERHVVLVRLAPGVGHRLADDPGVQQDLARAVGDRLHLARQRCQPLGRLGQDGLRLGVRHARAVRGLGVDAGDLRVALLRMRRVQVFGHLLGGEARLLDAVDHRLDRALAEVLHPRGHGAVHARLVAPHVGLARQLDVVVAGPVAQHGDAVELVLHHALHLAEACLGRQRRSRGTGGGLGGWCRRRRRGRAAEHGARLAGFAGFGGSKYNHPIPAIASGVGMQGGHHGVYIHRGGILSGADSCQFLASRAHLVQVQDSPILHLLHVGNLLLSQPIGRADHHLVRAGDHLGQAQQILVVHGQQAARPLRLLIVVVLDNVAHGAAVDDVPEPSNIQPGVCRFFHQPFGGRAKHDLLRRMAWLPGAIDHILNVTAVGDFAWGDGIRLAGAIQLARVVGVLALRDPERQIHQVLAVESLRPAGDLAPHLLDGQAHAGQPALHGGDGARARGLHAHLQRHLHRVGKQLLGGVLAGVGAIGT